MFNLLKTGLAFLAIIGLLLITAKFVSEDITYEKTIVINAPIDSVWQHTNSLTALEKWSYRPDYDPNIKTEISETDGIIGAKNTWESDHKKLGKGSETITKIEAPNLLETDLKYYNSYNSDVKEYIKLTPEGLKTKVSWGFSMEISYPFNLLKFALNMEEVIGRDFEIGLAKLRTLSERK